MADPDPLDTPFDIERSPLLEGIPHGFFGSSPIDFQTVMPVPVDPHSHVPDAW